jgi:hypothetical protein
MTMKLKALAIALPFVLGAAAPALADDYHPTAYENSYQYRDRDNDWRDNDAYQSNWGRGFLSPRQIEARLEYRGYRNVHNVSYSRSDRHYHADARDRRGNTVRLSVHPFSAQVLDVDYINTGRLMPFWRIERRLERDGFFNVEQLGTWNNRYRVEARDSRGRYVRLIVDGYTGEILRQRHADNGRRWLDREFNWN